MFNTERFEGLAASKQNNWQQRVQQLWVARIPVMELTQEELSACIWVGEIRLHQNQYTPPASFAELQAFVDLHNWLISLKHEWIIRHRFNPEL